MRLSEGSAGAPNPEAASPFHPAVLAAIVGWMLPADAGSSPAATAGA